MLGQIRLGKTKTFLFISGLIFSTLFFPNLSSASQDGISGCVKKKTGVLRISQKCKKSEYAIAWNFSGPAGPKGDKGDPGETTRVSSGGGGQGPTGPQGPIGPTGPQGPSGTNSSMMWLSPTDIYNNSAANSSLITVLLGGTIPTLSIDFWKADSFLVLRSLPHGWEDSSSITIRIYWVTLDPGEVTFNAEIYTGYITHESNLNSSFMNCRGSGAESTCENSSTGSVSSGPGKLNIIEITEYSFSSAPTEGGMLAISISRLGDYEIDDDGNNVPNPGADLPANLLGISISANFE